MCKTKICWIKLWKRNIYGVQDHDRAATAGMGKHEWLCGLQSDDAQCSLPLENNGLKSGEAERKDGTHRNTSILEAHTSSRCLPPVLR